MTRRRVARADGHAREVTIAPGGAVRVGETDLTVTAAADGGWRVLDASGRARVAYVVRSADGYWVHLDGAVCLVEMGEASRSEAQKRHGAGGTLAAPMPATVLSIAVEPGARVAAGDTLLVLEAMKMELPVRAPRDGTVAAVHCREGELVQPGVTLVDLS